METITRYKDLKGYAKEHGIDWRTAKRKVEKGEILLFLFRGKKVYIELRELQRFIFSKI